MEVMGKRVSPQAFPVRAKAYEETEGVWRGRFYGVHSALVNSVGLQVMPVKELANNYVHAGPEKCSIFFECQYVPVFRNLIDCEAVQCLHEFIARIEHIFTLQFST